MLSILSMFVIHTISYLTYVTAGGKKVGGLAVVVYIYIYMVFWGLRIRTRGKKSDRQRRCLQHNP